MARKKVNKKELTVEEKLEQKKQRMLCEVETELSHINEPSYFFKVGDKVRYGAMKECVVDEVLYNGKVYGLKCIATNNNYGHSYDYETYRVAMWTEVRPLESGDTTFAENQDVKLYFNNSTIDSLIHKHYHFGIDFNPDYQRGYVWEQEDKELLIDSVFKNIDIGKFVFIRLSDTEWTNRNLGYEILDGKQRLSTLIEFYEDKITYKGKYFNELSWKDKNVFLDHMISVAEVKETDRKTVLKYFLMLNRTGKAMDESHLNEVEQMLKELE